MQCFMGQNRRMGRAMITSTLNQKVKNVACLLKKAKERRMQGVFLAEGLRLFEEMPRDRLAATFVSETFLNREKHRQLLDGIAYEEVSDAVFKHMCDTQTPQGILSIVRRPVYEWADLMQGGRTHLLILEGIQDPGNLGTMFRAAEGAGVTGIIMDQGCVDLFAPKTVRSTMGSICRMPYYRTENLAETLSELKRQQVTLYAAHLNAEKYYDAFDYRGKTAFLIGSEGNGLTDETAGRADAYVKIPMGGKLESLNAALAAGILMYEADRQRRSAAG